MTKSRKMRKRISDNPSAGFTLIEVILSVAILAVVSVPIINYFTESMGYNVMTAKRQKATYLAQEITEGLLAEKELVAENAAPKAGASGEYDYTYEVPYFKGVDGVDQEDVEFKQDGNDLIYTYAVPEDGYMVKVTVTRPLAPDHLGDVNTLIDYGIDPLADVVYTEPTETYVSTNAVDPPGADVSTEIVESTVDKQAVFELVEKHNQYIFDLKEAAKNSGTEPSSGVEEVTDAAADDPNHLHNFKKNIERTMYVELRYNEVTDVVTGAVTKEYQVQIYYKYTCPAGVKHNSTDSACTWTSSVLMNRTVDAADLQNIYVVYHYSDNMEDKLVLRVNEDEDTTIRGIIASTHKPRLNIIYRDRGGNLTEANIPKLNLSVEKVKNDGSISSDASTISTLYGYTNTDLTPVSLTYDQSGTGVSAAGSASALVYTIHTEIYPEGAADSDEPLAEITTTKGE